MSKHYDGGSAFPVPEHEFAPGLTVGQSEGMTLRDYFAAKAMQGTMASDTFMSQIDTAAVDAKVPLVELMAGTAYAIADAMLKEREK